ncbi:MAG: hypothetical protein K2O30_00750, partial [Duncaniella sp.]|nr:hypothetical protein [Duncaniella sp.]
EVMYAEDLVNIFGKRPWRSRTEEIMEIQAKRDAARKLQESNSASDSEATSGDASDASDAPQAAGDTSETPGEDSEKGTPTPPPYKQQ